MNSTVIVPISIGELFDKISILEIKSERVTDETKLANVNYELGLLQEVAKDLNLGDSEAIPLLFLRLKDVNSQIWDAEDGIRDCERRTVFDERFLKLARSIYRLNDTRAAVKRELSVLTSSTVIEEKSYVGYCDEGTVNRMPRDRS